MLDTENKVGTEEYGQSSAAAPRNDPVYFPKKSLKALTIIHTHTPTHNLRHCLLALKVSLKRGQSGRGTGTRSGGLRRTENAKGQESGNGQRKLQTQRRRPFSARLTRLAL